MTLIFDSFTCKFTYNESIPDGWNKYYAGTFLLYINILYPIFQKAYETCEFSFLLTLLGFKGSEEPGWNTYNTSEKIINSIAKHWESITDTIIKINLSLWIYGHILEASEPYEIIYNILDIIDGKPYMIQRFPNNKNGAPQTPGEKIKTIKDKVDSLGYHDLKQIYNEIWDRHLRNSIFHSDFSLYKNEVRILNPRKIYSKEEISKLVNSTIAYFDALQSIQKKFISQYMEPKIINVPQSFSGCKNEKAIVIVRKGYGAIGIKDNNTISELMNGATSYRMGNFYPDKIELLNSNPLLAVLPEIN